MSTVADITYGELEIVAPSPGRVGERIALHKGPNRFGRRFVAPSGSRPGAPSGLLLELDDETISADHFIITAVETGCYITDLGSKNGTIVVAKQVQKQLEAHVSRLLHTGDRIVIGKFTLEYHRQVQLKAAKPSSSGSAGAVLPPEVALLQRHHDRHALVLPPISPMFRTQAEPLEKLANRRSEYMQYMSPPRYHTSNLINDLLLTAESIWGPIDELLNATHSYADPWLAPTELLDWIGLWFGISLDPTWPESQRRAMVYAAWELLSKRGTKAGCIEWIQRCTGYTATIFEYADAAPEAPLQADCFVVLVEADLTATTEELVRRQIEPIIALNMPVGTRSDLRVLDRAGSASAPPQPSPQP